MAKRHFRGTFKAVGLALVIALLAPMGVVLAGIAHVGSPSTSVIHSCVNTASGEIKIVGDSAVCKNGKSALDWNAVGPTGPTGTNGTNGIDGAPGPAGSTLVTGAAVTSAEDQGTNTTVDATATCSIGKVLLGGGGTVKTTGGAGNVALLASFPVDATTWKAVGVRIGSLGAGNKFKVTAYALCSL